MLISIIISIREDLKKTKVTSYLLNGYNLLCFGGLDVFHESNIE